MVRVITSKLKEQVGKTVEVKGFVQQIRDQSKVKFLILRDRAGTVQIVGTSEQPDVFKQLAKIPLESSIKIIGIVKAEKQAPGGVEIHATQIDVLSQSADVLPIPILEKQVSETVLSKRLDWRSLDLRRPESQAIFKIQSALLAGMSECLDTQDFIQVFTPCIMGVPSESGSEMFTINYFKEKAYLRQDPQLHRQLTIAGGVERLYDVGPSFRAELSHTVKHLCEHRTFAVEMAFIESEQDIMRLEEQVIISGLQKVNSTCKAELELLGIELKVPKAPFPELTFPEIYSILEEYGKKIRDQDLDSEADKIIWKHVKEKYDCEFYFTNHWRSDIKPFYVMRLDDNPTYARSVDLNWKGLEMSSGGQREHRYDRLMKQVKEKKVSEKSVEWFTKFFQFGVPPHGGFALGLERLTMSLLNLPNVRQAVLFPRDPERKEP